MLVVLAPALAGLARADDARDCVQARDAATSIKACTELIRQQPANIVAYNHRGNGHRAAGNYDAAIADFGKAIQMEPDIYARLQRPLRCLHVEGRVRRGHRRLQQGA